MTKIIKLTEGDLIHLIKRVLSVGIFFILSDIYIKLKITWEKL